MPVEDFPSIWQRNLGLDCRTRPNLNVTVIPVSLPTFDISFRKLNHLTLFHAYLYSINSASLRTFEAENTVPSAKTNCVLFILSAQRCNTWHLHLTQTEALSWVSKCV